eukprot:3385719-Lingulodinium_polyedra.AAC.1
MVGCPFGSSAGSTEGPLVESTTGSPVEPAADCIVDSTLGLQRGGAMMSTAGGVYGGSCIKSIADTMAQASV